ncbi:MAG: hypothetical protein SOZ59_10345 [Candidatus Limivivens sp.]|nr:hypothetical protein [Candidatus Limivivens sp.]
MNPENLSAMTNTQLQERVRRLEKENEQLRLYIQEQNKEILRLKGDNPRGAGRKAADDKWIANFSEFLTLKAAGADRNEIMNAMQISRATYYRYQKLFNETNLADSDRSI